MDGYVLRDLLGTGTHGEVWRAEVDGRPGRLVAIKRLRATADDDGPAGRVEDVRRDAAALERLAHPGIVSLLDVVADDDRGGGIALVMPFLPGGTLATRIAAQGPLPAAAVADLGARLGDALAATHAAGVVHGDVTPRNVLYDAEEQPLLADFGAATFLGGHRRLDVRGTALYIDPDVASGRRSPDPAADQYGLAVVLHEALSGTPPYAAPSVDATLRAADRGRRVPLADLVPEAPEALVAAIERGLARDPADRFPTIRELAARLEEVRATLPTWTPSAGPTPSTMTPWLATARTGRPGGGPGRRRQGGPDRSGPAGDPGAPDRTRRFGPAPPTPPPTSHRRLRLWPLLGAVAVLLTPPVVLAALLLSRS